MHGQQNIKQKAITELAKKFPDLRVIQGSLLLKIWRSRSGIDDD
jgi:hypothetical protein